MARARRQQNRRGRKGRRDGDVVGSQIVTSQVHRFCRMKDWGKLTQGLADSGFVFDFRLNHLPNYAEFQALFDMWKIEKVDLMFIYNGSTTSYPTIFFAVDYDGTISSPASRDVLLQYERAEVLQFAPNRQIIKRSINPRFCTMVSTGGGSSQGVASRAQWGDCIDADQIMHGCVFWIEGYNTGLAVTQSVSLVVRYHLAVKTAR